MTALDDHARLLDVSERWRRLYEESQTELEHWRQSFEGAAFNCETLQEQRNQAEAEVERLRVENARLREALTAIAALHYPDDPPEMMWCVTCVEETGWPCPTSALILAAAATTGDDDGD